MNSLFFKTLFLCIALTLSSCSDFTNSKKDAPDSGSNPTPQDPTPNPFPPGYDKPNEQPFTEERMLVNIGVNVIAPQVRRFRLQTELLQNQVQEYCQALQTEEDIERKEENVREQWIEAMLEYHRLEAAPVGPLSDSQLVLASKIYSYPYTNTCGLDFHIARGNIANLPQLPFSIKGLATLEYLLFEPTLNSSCNPNAFPDTHRWAAEVEPLQKKKDRCQWAQALSEDLTANARLLERYWDVDEGNYTKSLIDGSLYPSPRKATNAVSDALFAIENLKDQRLGKPLGLHKDCPEERASCPEMAEHPYSGIALEAQAQSLRFFKQVFMGTQFLGLPGYGFDDLLAAHGHIQTAPQLEALVNRALQTNTRLREQGSLREQIAQLDPLACENSTPDNRLEELCAYQKEVREIVNFLKTDILTALSLVAPPVYQGDND